MTTKRNDAGIGRYQWTPELVQENIRRFHKFKSEGTLGNNGPKMPGNSTLFSPDRWKAMLEDMNRRAPKAAKKFSDATNMKVGQSTKEASKKKDFEEFVVDKNEMKITKVGEGLPAKGMLKTVKDSKGGAHLLSAAQPKRPGPEVTNQNDAQTAINKEAIAAKYDKVRFDNLEAELQRKKAKKSAEIRGAAQEKISGVKDKLSDILTNYSSVDKLESQKAKAAEVAAKRQADLQAKAAKEQEALQSKMMDSEIVDITKEFADLDEEYSNDRLEAALKGADDERKSMEAGADLRDNPMLSLTDKEKGDFEFKALEPKDKSGQAGITLIMQETGLDGGKATALMGKLKGLCGN